MGADVQAEPYLYDMFPKAAKYVTDFIEWKERAAKDYLKATLNTVGDWWVNADPGIPVTTFLADRTTTILSTTKVLPAKVLCITGSDSATLALQRKLLLSIEPEATNIVVRTMPAFCAQVIKDNQELLGNPAPLPISTLEGIRLLTQIIAGFPTGHPLKKYRGDVYGEINNLTTLFRLIKNEGIDTQLFQQATVSGVKKMLPAKESLVSQADEKIREDTTKIDKLRAGIHEFAHYQQCLQNNDRYDQEDLPYLLIKAAEENKELFHRCLNNFSYIQVADFEVINAAERKLLQLMLRNPAKPNTLIVNIAGQSNPARQKTDPNREQVLHEQYQQNGQVISLNNYYFSTRRNAGADMEQPEQITDHRKKEPLSPTITVSGLTGNLPIKQCIKKPCLTSYNSTIDEIAAIMHQVSQFLNHHSTAGKIAIVYSNDAWCAELEQYFLLKKIPFCSKRTINILDQSFIRKIVNLLRYISRESTIPFSGDDLLFEILHTDFYKVPPVEIAQLSLEANGKRFNRAATIRKILQEKSNALPKDLFDTGIHPDLKKLSSILEKLIVLAPGISVSQLLETMIKEMSLRIYVDQSKDRDWLTQLLTTLIDFINIETAHNPRLTVVELMVPLEIMIKERVSLPMVRHTGNTENVQFIKAGEAIEQSFNLVFIAGLNYDLPAKIQWFSGNSQLYKEPVLFPSNPDEENDLRSLRHLFYWLQSDPEIQLRMSWLKCNENGKELPLPRFVEEITLLHSLPFSHIELTPEQKSFSLMMSKQSPELQALPATFINPIVQKFVMNVSALNSYLHCPLVFYFNNILRVPSGNNEALVFGSAVHYALEELFKKMSAGDEAGSSKQYRFAPAVELVAAFAVYMETHRTQLSSEAFERRLKYGTEVLQLYYQQYIDRWNKVVSVERTISGVTIRGVPLKGKPDKLEFNGREVNITDYKTGDVEKALEKMNPPHDGNPNGGDYWRQAVFYTLLVNHYTKKEWKAVSVEFDFIEPDINGQYRKEKIFIQPADEETVVQQFTSVWHKIQALEFYAGCGRSACYWCNFVKDNYPG